MDCITLLSQAQSVDCVTVGDLSDLRSRLRKALLSASWVKNTKDIEYLNAPIAYDIETTSFTDNGDKRGLMYAWSFAVGEEVIIGRTWDEFLDLLEVIQSTLSLDVKRRIIVYVHNLGFEFQFFRHYLEWEKVFSIREREPLYALTTGGIEFRCSYKLTNYSLANVAKGLKSHSIRKMVGDLDYSLLRHSGTPLTEEEKGYMRNDVLIITALIAEEIARCGDITRIPLTSTGYVRRLCMQKTNSPEYHKLLRRLTLGEDEYTMLRDAFQGGFTHANARLSGQTLYNVGSFDETSAYPAALVREQYPMGKAQLIDVHTEAELQEHLRNYCCLFAAGFKNLRPNPKLSHEHPLSASHCKEIIHPVYDNGRVVTADGVVTVITEQDYYIYRQYYEWDEMRVTKCYRYKKDYLPRELILAILELYAAKTQLKGVQGREDEYQHSKEMLNSAYGMMVTEICRPIYGYEDEWLPTTAPNIRSELERYNKSKSRFLYYPWGVWCTAYNRTALFSAIASLGDDYCYSDTDSSKFLNADRHKEWFTKYNETNRQCLMDMCKARDIDPALIEPMTVQGKKKLLGAWEYEGTYDVFKTLGAKRYLTQTGKELHLTVAGLSKQAAVKWLSNTPEPYETFSDGMEVPPEHTGKQTHTYIDAPAEGHITDYLGNTMPYSVKSAVHLEAAGYKLTLSKDYIAYILGIITKGGRSLR